MPRDGLGIYSQPAPDVTSATPIESAVYNAFVADVEQDLNAPRPVVAGGTGANNAADAMTTLGGELASQVVTNYDSYVFKAGSFLSAEGATAAPTPTGKYSGIVTVIDNDNKVLRATNHATGEVYVRIKTTTWSAWALELAGVNTDITDLQDAVIDLADDILALQTADTAFVTSLATLDTNKVDITGDTMTGPLLLHADPSVDLGAATKGYVDDAIGSIPGGAGPSGTTPIMDGVAAVGAETTFARGDHVHPTDTAIATKSNITRTINAQTGTSYTFVIGDAGNVVTGANAAATIWTVPPNGSVAFPVGTQIDLGALGAGQISITPGSGVTITSEDSKVKLSKQGSGATLLKTATDTWLLTGSLAA